MRKLISLFCLLVCFAGSAWTQTNGFVPLYYAGTKTGDTLVNQDTAIYYIGGDIQSRFDMGIIFSVTQVTGTNAGTITLQGAFPRKASLTNAQCTWFQISQQTLTGGGTTLWTFARSTIVERRLRVVIITPAGTRRTAVSYEGAMKLIR